MSSWCCHGWIKKIRVLVLNLSVNFIATINQCSKINSKLCLFRSDSLMKITAHQCAGEELQH